MNRGLLATQDELAGLAGRIGVKPFDRMHDLLLKRCALILESKPISETMWRSAWSQGRRGAATAAAVDIQGRVLDLVVAHKIDRNAAYRDRAIEELRNLLRFSTWTDPSHGDLSADLCTGEAAAAVAIALDWLADELGAADRQACVKALRDKALQPYLEAVEAGAFWYSCYHNWNAVVNGGVALAGLLLSDADDLAAAAVVKATDGLGRYFKALGREGGWDEGLGFWGHGMRYVLLLAEALARVNGDHSLYRRRGMAATGLFPVYFAPHGQAVSFGGGAMTPAWGTFYLLGKHFGLREIVWWLDRYALRHDVVTSGYSHAGLALLFRPTDLEPEPEPELEPVKVFKEIGWAAMADAWPVPDLYAALKTGDLAANHAQLDMNSAQIMFGGEVLLRDPPAADLPDEPPLTDGPDAEGGALSASHNTVTAAGREHRIDAVGGIVEAGRGKNFRWIAGDAGGALGEDVRFIRHVVMPVGAAGASMVIVLDEIHNVVAEELAARWHTGGTLELDADGAAGRIEGVSAAVHFALAADCGFRVTAAGRGRNHHGADSVITLSTPRVRRALIVAAFAAEAVGEIALARSERGDVDLAVGHVALRFQADRKHLRLTSVKGASDDSDTAVPAVR